MGVVASYIGYRSRKQSFTPYGAFSLQLHEVCRLPLIIGDGVAASLSIANLCTQLAAMEKDIRVSQAENKNKESVIDYLLQTNVRNASVNGSTAKLQGQLLALRAAIEQTHKEVGEIKEKLGKAEDAIITLSALNAPGSRSQSISTSSSNRSDPPPKSEAVSGNLIDLLDCSQDFSQDSSHAKAVEEDTTLLDNYYEEDLEIEGVLKNTIRDQSIPQSSDSEFEGSSYIVRFTDSDEDDIQGDAIKTSTSVLHQELLSLSTC